MKYRITVERAVYCKMEYVSLEVLKQFQVSNLACARGSKMRALEALGMRKTGAIEALEMLRQIKEKQTRIEQTSAHPPDTYRIHPPSN